MKRPLSIAVLLIFAFMSVPAVSMADIYMKRKRHMDAVKVMGAEQPASDVIEEIWITKKGFRSDDAQKSMMMLTDQQKMIMIDHASKTYFEKAMDMSDMMDQSLAGKSPEEAAAMQQMMKSMMKMDVTVKPTDEKKEIKGWMCKKYILIMNTLMGAINNEIWATEELKVDQEMYDQLLSSMTSMMPDMSGTIKGLQEEMKKIKGVQVMSITTQNIMNQTQTSTTELMEFKEKQAPKTLFQIPAGYVKGSF